MIVARVLKTAFTSGSKSSICFVWSADHNHREIQTGEILLVRNTLIRCERHVVTCEFGGTQKIAILFALQARPLGSVHVVASKAIPEIDGRTLIEK